LAHPVYILREEMSEMVVRPGRRKMVMIRWIYIILLYEKGNAKCTGTDCWKFLGIHC